MNKNYWNHIFTKWFDLPKNKRILFYQNPNQFKDFKYEKINPNHVGIITGHSKKYKNTWLKVCRITITQIHLFFFDLYKQLITTFNYLFDNMDIMFCCYYIFIACIFYCVILNLPFVEAIVCLKK